MAVRAIVAGTGFEGRAVWVRKHCKPGLALTLKREPNNPHDPNAIAVYVPVPRLGGLFGTASKQIGYIKSGAAKRLAKHLDAGRTVTATIVSFYAPDEWDFPRVSVDLEY